MNVIKILLHYKNDDMTRNVIKNIPDCILINNNPTQTWDGINTRKDLRMYGGFNFAIQKFYNDYDAFWLLTNDIEINNNVFNVISNDMEQNPEIGIIQAAISSGSPWPQMLRSQSSGLKYVKWIEPIAPLIKKEVFDKTGLFDAERFPYSWGEELNFAYKVRKAGFKIVVDCNTEFKHLGTGEGYDESQDEYYLKARTESNNSLTELYGPNWKDILLDDDK